MNDDEAKALLPQEGSVGDQSGSRAKPEPAVGGSVTLAGSCESGAVAPLSKLPFLIHGLGKVRNGSYAKMKSMTAV